MEKAEYLINQEEQKNDNKYNINININMQQLPIQKNNKLNNKIRYKK